MNLKGRRFMSKGGKPLTIRDFNESMTYFEDGSKVETKFILDKRYFTEMPIQQNQQNNQQNIVDTNKIDPSLFFNQKNLLFEQMQSYINTQVTDEWLEKMPTDNGVRRDNGYYPLDNTSAIIQADPEMERLEIERKYNISKTNTSMTTDPQGQINKQMNSFMSDPKLAKILEEEGQVHPDFKPQSIPQIQQPQQFRENKNSVQSNYIPPNETGAMTHIKEDPTISDRRINQPNQFNQYIDPIIVMFQKTKRPLDFKLSLEIENKIPRLDIIEMMEDSYDISMIEYLAQEITEKLLANPSLIKDRIVGEIKDLLNGEPHSKIFKNGKKSKFIEIIEEEIPVIKEVKLVPEKKDKKVKTIKNVEVEVITEIENTEIIRNNKK